MQENIVITQLIADAFKLPQPKLRQRKLLLYLAPDDYRRGGGIN